MSDVRAEVLRILAGELSMDSSAIGDHMSLGKDLNIDSVDALDLMFRFERAFGVSIPDDDVMKLQTVGDIVDYIEQVQVRS